VNYVRPGYIRVNAASNSSNLHVSSYLSPEADTLVIVAINDTNLVLSNVNFICPISNIDVTSYATCDVPDYSTTQLGSIPAPVNGRFSADIQAMSVETFVVSLQRLTGNINDRLPQRVLYDLNQNYPNPFNPSTVIRYALPMRTHVTLTVFNTLGQQVATLVNDTQEAGYHDVRFDGSNLASGVYFYRLRAGDFVQTKTFVILR
jgi:hypothetical protein